MRNHSSHGIFISKKKRGVKIDNNSMFAEYPDVLSIEQLQEMLHIGRNTAYDLLKDSTIKTIKIGKKYIIPKASVINFILGNI